MNEQSNPRRFDTAIARLLHLDVLGEAPCWRSPEDGQWLPSWYENDPGDTTQLIYLANCDCTTCREPEDVDRFGHTAGCLKVVPFYHLDCNLAVVALEQVCDERELVVKSNYEDGRWIVALWNEDHDVAGVGKSLVLAICKALAGLKDEIKNKSTEKEQPDD